MPETSHFKVFVDGVKVDSLWLKRGESKYVAPIPPISSSHDTVYLYLMQDHPWISRQRWRT